MSLCSSFYHGSAIALLVYDITNYDSFLSIPKWLNELKKYADHNILVTLVGNKNDLEDERKVDTLEAKHFAGKSFFNVIILVI